MRGGLIPLDTEPGQRLLEEAASADYAPLARHYQGQELHTYCGVASGVITLNALHGEALHRQQTFLAPALAALLEEERVLSEGMTLDEFGSLLVSHGARATVHHALDAGLDASSFRTIAEQNLGRCGDFLVVNYLRETLGQSTGGHFSPLAEFHAGSDRFLVLDVADFKYTPVWVETPALFAAMATVDVRSGLSRGFVAISL
jgi:hypothetical protein